VLSSRQRRRTNERRAREEIMIGARVLAGVVLAAVAITGHAQSKYPDKPIKILVGFSAGGGTDVAARIVGQKLGEALGQSFVIENRPGASGLIASEMVAKAPADGYTMMVGSQTTLAVAPALYRSIQIDAPKAFSGMAMVGISPLVAVVPASSPIKSMAELIAYAKSQPGGLTFGSGGVGTTPHMSGELLGLNAGIKMVHVAYKGEAPGINDLLGGQIPFMFSNLSVVKGNVEGGKLRALAVTSSARVPSLPDVPTVAETFPGFDAATWFNLVVPAGTPPDVVAKVHTEMKKIVATKDYQQRLDAIGMIPDKERSPDEINTYIRSEIAKWANVIKDAGIKPAD
jgi:tripartite-type tricarboxylate transporter receptor subunit TctC